MEGPVDSCAQRIRRGRVQTWIQDLKGEFFNSHLASNVFFSMILALLEKFVELEFACPCNPYYNTTFASVFFIFPGILSFMLMMGIRRSKSEKSMLLCCSPAMIWLILTFLDGQYFACAMTYWSGHYETVPQSDHQKWCNPGNASDKSEELLRKTAQWFCLSQVIGILFIILACSVQLICFKSLKQESQEQGTDYQAGTVMALQVLGESGNTNTQGSELSTV